MTRQPKIDKMGSSEWRDVLLDIHLVYTGNAGYSRLFPPNHGANFAMHLFMGLAAR